VDDHVAGNWMRASDSDTVYIKGGRFADHRHLRVVIRDDLYAVSTSSSRRFAWILCSGGLGTRGDCDLERVSSRDVYPGRRFGCSRSAASMIAHPLCEWPIVAFPQCRS